jgi:hypothetical protein
MVADEFLFCQIIDFIYTLGAADDISDVATAESRQKCPLLASSHENRSDILIIRNTFFLKTPRHHGICGFAASSALLRENNS